MINADLWLLNSCTVKNPAEDGFKNEIRKAQDMGKYVVVAGCVPQGQPKSEFIKGLSVIGVSNILFVKHCLFVIFVNTYVLIFSGSTD